MRGQVRCMKNCPLSKQTFIFFNLDANVFCNIFGDYGDTGNRPLSKTKNKNKFERGQLDVFQIEAVKLRSIRKIIIGHDGKNPGAGWFLARVIIKQVGNTKYDQVF